MKRILYVLSRRAEIPHIQRLMSQANTNTSRYVIISTSPEVNIELLRLRVPFQDIGDFYPLSHRSSALQKKLVSFATTWCTGPSIQEKLTVDGVCIAKAAMFGLHMHLGEIGHSILTAERLLREINPSAVYGSTALSSLPFRRYDEESLSHEGWAIELVAKRNRIPFTTIVGATPLWMLGTWVFLKHLATLFIHLVRSGENVHPTRAPIVFLGNYYQLTNLLLTILECQKQRRPCTTIGKATPEQRDDLAKRSIPFTDLTMLARPHRVDPLFFTLRFLWTWYTVSGQIKRMCHAIHPLLWDLLKPKLCWYFAVEYPELATLSGAVKPLFEESAKALVTMATSDHVSRTIALTAQHHGVNVVELQHGFYLVDFEYFLRSNDYFLLWHPIVRNVLVGATEHSDHYPIAGYPWFDQYRSLDRNSARIHGLKEILAPKKRKVILMLATMPKDLDDDRLTLSTSPYQYVSLVFSEIAKRRDRWHVVFRPHPSSPSRWVIDLAKWYGLSFFYDDRSIPLPEVIAASDIVVANFTTALLDTMFIGKPILLYTFRAGAAKDMDAFTRTYGVPWKRFEAAEEFSRFLNTYHSNEKERATMRRSQQNLLHEQVPHRRASATDEILSFVQRLSQSP